MYLQLTAIIVELFIQISTPNLLGDHEGESVEEDMTNFWPTSAGKFHFCIDELPQELQYIHQLLQV